MLKPRAPRQEGRTSTAPKHHQALLFGLSRRSLEIVKMLPGISPDSP
jgi:hypothetical protein